MSYGTSTFASISDVVEIIKREDPKTILDVGCGYGRWGFLAREALDIWEGRHRPKDWQCTIVGLDGNPDNQSSVHSQFYDAYYCMLLEDFSMEQGPYDLVIANDVIEHMEKTLAFGQLLKLSVMGKKLLLGLPIGPGWLRGPRPDNHLEAHLSEWAPSDISERFTLETYKQYTLTWPGEAGLEYGLFMINGPRPEGTL